MGDFRVDPRRACRDAAVEVFVTPGDADDEPPYPSPEARRYCAACPVRADCLEYALAHEIDFGVWGGMSSYQRRLLTRPRRRRVCPGCDSVDVIIEGSHEICLACGVSWEIL